MRKFIENELGEITEKEFDIALGAGDNYLENCKNNGEGATTDDLIKAMIDSIKRYRRVA
jgi:hypothetical protein